MKLTHLDAEGNARMVDVSGKPRSLRTARARAWLRVAPDTASLIREQALPKGSPFEVAKLAGIQAAKETSRLIPLCHSLHLDFVDVTIRLEGERFKIDSEVRCRRATGVEMEALTAVSVTALTLYDMCKAVDNSMEIERVFLVSKEKSGLE